MNKEEALKNRRFDPVTWGVNTKTDLESWAEWLDGKGVKRSRLLKGAVGWLIVFEVRFSQAEYRSKDGIEKASRRRKADSSQDPDGRFLRLYTYETHEMTADVDEDAYWLGSEDR